MFLHYLSVLLKLAFLGSIVNSHPLEIFQRVKRDAVTGWFAKKPDVHLTVTSLTSGGDRLLEMNWLDLPDNLPGLEELRVQLYNQDPSSPGSSPLVSVVPTKKGYYRTSVRFPVQIFNESNLTDACLGFWVVVRRNEEAPLLTDCIRAHPHWMYNSRSDIGNLSLTELMLPGTHNAGSYSSFNPKEDTLFNRYLFTQEENIWNQLVFGIRYLDLRVAYRRTTDSDEVFWITHSSFRTDIPVREVIRQVKKFLRATREVVVMDFHRFVTGFQNKRSSAPRRRHRELYTMLEQELGEYMIPSYMTSDAPLHLLWQSNKRLYVGYADERSRTQSRLLFPAIRHLWGDVDQVEDLKSFLNDTVCDKTRKRLTSAMAQLTPTTSGVLFNVYGGLRKMADAVNHQVTKWFRDEWNNCANIVATDYFLGNDIIRLAIETNKNRKGITDNDF